MAKPELRVVVGEARPSLTLRWALASRCTSMSWVPDAADVLAETSKADVLVLLALNVLKLLWSLSAVIAVLTCDNTNDIAE